MWWSNTCVTRRLAEKPHDVHVDFSFIKPEAVVLIFRAL
jgi:hypothetical protein